MPRHRKRKPPADPAPVLVVCRDPYHHDEGGYAERGHHVVGELRSLPATSDRPWPLEWTGHGPEPGPLRTPGITIAADLPPGTPPIKRYRHGDGPAPWRIRCSCGLDRQPTEARLAAIIAAWVKAFPCERCLIDMCRL